MIKKQFLATRHVQRRQAQRAPFCSKTCTKVHKSAKDNAPYRNGYHSPHCEIPTWGPLCLRSTIAAKANTSLTLTLHPKYYITQNTLPYTVETVYYNIAHNFK